MLDHRKLVKLSETRVPKGVLQKSNEKELNLMEWHLNSSCLISSPRKRFLISQNETGSSLKKNEDGKLLTSDVGQELIVNLGMSEKWELLKVKWPAVRVRDQPTSLAIQPFRKEPLESRNFRVKNARRRQKDPKMQNTNALAPFFRNNDEEEQIHTELIEKSKFNCDEKIVTQMLMDLHEEQMHLLKIEFDAHDNELELDDFIEIMQKYLPEARSETDQVDQVKRLSAFFYQVDVNNDGSMEWKEFTSFIVDANQKRAAFRVDTIKDYQPRERIRCATHDTRIDFMHYSKELDHVIACDNNRMMSVFSGKDMKLIHQAYGHKGVIHSAAYLYGKDESSFLATAANDCTIGFWDPIEYRLRQQIPCSKVQTNICWTGPQINRVLTGANDGIVSLWDPDRLSLTRTMKEQHLGAITDSCFVPNMDNAVATASLDSSIKFWDLETGNARFSLRGHEKGCLSISYCSEHRVLVSAGFGHDILVWNPYIQKLICPLKGHLSSLVSVEAVEGTPEVISVDCEGFIKIWDMRNFSCVQTLSAKDRRFADNPNLDFQNGAKCKFVNESRKVLEQSVHERREILKSMVPGSSLKQSEIETAVSCALYVRRHRRLLVANHDICSFEYSRAKDPELSHSEPISGVLFNEKTLTIITFGGGDVKIWDAETGCLLRVYRDLVTIAEITAMTFDCQKRKFCIGDSKGNVKLFNFANGALLQEIGSLQGEIISIVSFPSEERFIAACSSGQTQVFDVSDPERSLVALKMDHHGALIVMKKMFSDICEAQEACQAKAKIAYVEEMKSIGEVAQIQELSVLAVSFVLKQVVSADSDTSIIVFDLRSGADLATCIGHEHEIMNAQFIDPFGFMVSSDSAGFVCFWQMDEFSRILRPLTKIENECVVRCFQWNFKDLLLCVGDEKGRVKLCNMRELATATKAQSKRLVSTNQLSQEDAGSFFLTADKVVPQRPRMGKFVKSPSLRMRRNSTQSMNSPWKVEAMWKAHESSVQSISLITRSDALTTYSNDRLVKIWSTKGELLGLLQQGKSDPNWKLNPNRWLVEQEEDQQAAELLHDTKSRFTRIQSSKFLKQPSLPPSEMLEFVDKRMEDQTSISELKPHPPKRQISFWKRSIEGSRSFFSEALQQRFSKTAQEAAQKLANALED